MSLEKTNSTSLKEDTKQEIDVASTVEGVDFGGESKLPPAPTLTEEEERKLWRKVDLKLMPILSLMYLLSFLDRGELPFPLGTIFYSLTIFIGNIGV